ncbi:MAG: 3D domain-containing protein [Planctomycetota bacterium]|jgi:3D (Asp-Asp-Asp) domain-containing protein
MRSRSKNRGYIVRVNRKFILEAILLLVLLYTLTATSGFTSTKAGSDSLRAMSEDTEDSLQVSGQKPGSWYVIEMRVTAYCWCWKCCGKHSDGITANGHRIRIGDTFVAADKKYLFGTEMIVPGYNNSQPVKVLDRGRVIKGNRLDIFFNSHHRAKVWGVRYLPVKVRVR